MKKIIAFLSTALAVLSISAQSASTSPGTGHWVVIDSGYQVATTTVGQTVAPLYFYNTSTSEKITGMQFRVRYDNTAFTAVVPSLKISTTDQYLQYVDNKATGDLSVTVVYTGTNASFNYSNGATFDLTFTHASAATWNTLDSIKSLKIKNVASWNDLASTNYGNDTTLTVYSYGGRFNQKVLRFAAKFKNVTGSDAKNLWVSLEKKSPSGSWTQVEAKATNSTGVVIFRKFIDTTYWDVRMVVKGDTMTPGSVFSTADAQKINQAILSQYTPTGFDYYTMDVNGSDGTITIADVYSVYGRLAGRFSTWPNSKKDVMFFTVAEYDAINGASSNLTSTFDIQIDENYKDSSNKDLNLALQFIQKDFEYTKESTSEYSESYTEDGYMKVSEAEETFLLNKIDNINGSDWDRDIAVNYKGESIFSDEEEKMSFFNDPNQDSFLELCIRNNFKIQRDIPWRIFLDIRTKGPNIGSFSEKIVKYIPTFTDNLQDFFDKYYIRVVPYDKKSFPYFQEFVNILQSFYNSFLTLSSTYKKYSVNSCGNANVLTFNKTSMDESAISYDREKYLKLYFDFRNLSTANKETSPDFSNLPTDFFTELGYTPLSLNSIIA